ncbi:hypothetical protein MLD38_000734 [Melastoma candidum]|uniref:Uncharacterized protein n=1 Tax=Melastoma candidum TaxID=119954 RepID=A0ACB9SD07_9MYRT|nr:hypothetical protein MLD38_000734 [Melastoma candidum]
MELQSVCRGISAPRVTGGTLLGRKAVRLDLRRIWVGKAKQDWGAVVLCQNDGSRRNLWVCAAGGSQGDDASVRHVRRPVDGVEPFRGKSGSVSFYGLTHQLVEEGKLESAPFEKNKGSLLWVLAPVALISSLIVPQFLLGNAIEAFLNNETFVEIVTSLAFDATFYVGLATFLFVTDRVQRPYLQFSPKRWSLITGLRGYLSSAFFTMGFKVLIPLFMIYISWPELGLPSVVAVAPFLTGCLAQLAFDKSLEKSGSSCWPLVPIIFEVYRLYQLTKAAHYIERLMYAMKDLPTTPQLLDRSGALVATIASFQILGLLCLWSLVTFLLRLFPSRPVSENY